MSKKRYSSKSRRSDAKSSIGVGLLLKWLIPIIALGWILYLAMQEEGLSWPPSLDFSGGVRLEYVIDDEDAIRQGIESSEDKKTALERTQEIFLFRLREFDLSEIIVKSVGDNRIIVEVPGTEAIIRVKEEIGNAAKLNFRIITSDEWISEEQISSLSELDKESFFLLEGTDIYLQVSDPVFDSTGIHYSRTNVDLSARTLEDPVGNEPYINLVLRSNAVNDFAGMTTEYYGKQLAICLDNVIVSAPKIAASGIREPIITGEFTMTEARDLEKILRSGPLPVSLNLKSESLLSPGLGQANLQRSLIALGIGLALAILILVLAYSNHLAFLVTLGICLVLEFVFLYIFALMGWLTLSMISLAGTVILLGVSIDNLILVFEEFRGHKEEQNISQFELLSSIGNAFESEKSIILLANVTTLLTLIPLYFISGPVTDLVKVIGFGVLINLAITIWFAGNLLTTKEFVIPLEEMSARSPLFAPRLNLFSYIRPLSVFYLVAVIISIGLLIFQGIELGLDFKGGSEIVLLSERGIVTEELQSYASDYFGERVEVKRVRGRGLTEDESYQYLVWIPNIELTNTILSDNEDGTAAPESASGNVSAENFAARLPKLFSSGIRLGSVDLLGPTVIGLRLSTVIIVIVIGLFLLTIAVALQYGGRYAIPVLVALILDCLIIIGVISLFQVPLSLPIVAAIVTIIGYSVNDSIVLCGHVNRECDNIDSNLKKLSGNELFQAVKNPEDKADEYFGKILAVLSPRVVLTGLPTILITVSLWITGQGIIRDFGLVIAAGVVFSTLSSFTIVAMRLRSLFAEDVEYFISREFEIREEKATGGYSPY